VTVVETDQGAHAVFLPAILTGCMGIDVHRFTSAIPSEEIDHVNGILERGTILRTGAVLLGDAEACAAVGEGGTPRFVHRSEAAVESDHEDPCLF
jgi:hypothetical protein